MLIILEIKLFKNEFYGAFKQAKLKTGVAVIFLALPFLADPLLQLYIAIKGQQFNLFIANKNMCKNYN